EHFIEVFIFYGLGIFEICRRYKSKGLRGLFHPVVFSFIFGVTAIRNILWFFWIYILSFDTDILGQREQTNSKLNKQEIVFVIVIAAALLSLFPPVEKQLHTKMNRYTKYTPVMATEAIIHDGSDGVIFNEFEFGGYLIYRL